MYMGARVEFKAEAATKDIEEIVPEVNFTFFTSGYGVFHVNQESIKYILFRGIRLDILIENAGIFATPPRLMNHALWIKSSISHMPALLTKPLLPVLKNNCRFK